MWFAYIFIGLLLGWFSFSKMSMTVQQYVRLFDTFVSGPMKMFLGYKIYTNKWLPEFFAAFLMVGGAITTSVNMKEYIENRKSIGKDISYLIYP